MVHSVFLRKINRSLGVQCSISSVCNAVQFKVETPKIGCGKTLYTVAMKFKGRT